mmetsp:Transcript_21404/g.61960  ORF Transcript_21404/g.61960 Transcript_21404/m.61960 type:complete len:214 (+) Transcript_21404:106-747(+)
MHLSVAASCSCLARSSASSSWALSGASGSMEGHRISGPPGASPARERPAGASGSRRSPAPIAGSASSRPSSGAPRGASTGQPNGTPQTDLLPPCSSTSIHSFRCGIGGAGASGSSSSPSAGCVLPLSISTGKSCVHRRTSSWAAAEAPLSRTMALKPSHSAGGSRSFASGRTAATASAAVVALSIGWCSPRRATRLMHSTSGTSRWRAITSLF